MKLPIAYYGNPILRKKADRVDEITDDLRQLVTDMEETMFAHDGIGLAAPQVNRSIALFIIHVPKQVGPEEWENGTTHVFINPKIIKYSEEEWYRGEGCLSIPQVFGTVCRPMHVTVEATNIEGKRFTAEFSGLEARAVMHENDHINGVLFIDRVKGKERDELEPLLKEVKKHFSKKK